MSKLTFPKDFIWGAATAAYQIEGAVKEDDRGESIWDRFSHTPGKIKNGETGDIACDHYHRFKADVALMKKMGLKGYRFSIAWPRIFPTGKGQPNQKGIDFYKALLDELLSQEIDPLVTLYHWDLPQALQDQGGWDNRQTADYFSDYAAYVFDALGDRVKKWLTLNEPSIVSLNGNAIGEHAPGFTDYALAIRVSHHLNLAHAKAIKIYRQSGQKGEIGATLNLTTVYPASDTPEDKAAAWRVDGHNNRWYLDPVLKGAYPQDMLKLYSEKLNAPIIRSGDLELLASAKIDYLGVNYYSRKLVKNSLDNSFLNHLELRPDGSSYTSMDWEIYPQGLYDLLIQLDRDYHHPRIFITENGAAFNDQLQNNRVDDIDRINYTKAHFTAAYQAIQSGVALEGYYVWSLLDNFEWAHGFSKRFGLIFIDYLTQERIWKESAYWYKDVIKNNGFNA
jgi:beta-glucosidase